MAIKIIVINGFSTSGKDEFVTIYKKLSKHKVINMSSVDRIKEIAIEQFGWDGVRDVKGRKLLSDLKDASTAYNDFPLMMLKNRIILEHESNTDVTIFYHCREPLEIAKACALPNSISLCMRRTIVEEHPDAMLIAGNEDVLNYKPHYDVEIRNDSTLVDLSYQIESFIKSEQKIFDDVKNAKRHTNA